MCCPSCCTIQILSLCLFPFFFCRFYRSWERVPRPETASLNFVSSCLWTSRWLDLWLMEKSSSVCFTVELIYMPAQSTHKPSDFFHHLGWSNSKHRQSYKSHIQLMNFPVCRPMGTDFTRTWGTTSAQWEVRLAWSAAGPVDSAGLMESTVLLQTCVKLPDASTSLCMMLMTLAGLGRRT